MKSNEYWSTKREIDFLNGIGTYSERKNFLIPKLILLEGYYHAAKKRKNWDSLDSKEIINHVKKLIKKEKNNVKNNS